MSHPGFRTVPRWMVGCLLVAALLRLFRLSHQSFWIDELISLQLATYAQGAEFFRGLLIDIHGPFLTLLLHGWVRLGESEGWVRLLFVIPSVATIPFFYRLVTELFHERAGRVAAWALALSPFHVWYAQEVRAYAWVMLWTVVALWLFVRIWDGRGGRGTAVALAATLALAVLSNFSVVFLLAALSVAVVVRRPFAPALFRTWSLVLVGVSLVFLPWFLDWFGRIGGERLFVNAPSPVGMPLRETSGFSPAEVPYAPWSFLYGYSLGPSLRQLHLDRSPGALAPYLPVALLGGLAVAGAAWKGWGEVRRCGRTALVTALLLVPFALGIYLALRGVKTFHPRYLTAAFPVFLAVPAAGWAVGRGRMMRGSAVLAIALASFSLAQHYFDPAYAKEDNRSAAALVASHEQPGDSVVVIYAWRPFDHYFTTKDDGRARMF
ncbi:glycosyltransferase family 39 protein, partial [bacterium]|nr:glycosyltransferase family 39 protein [bacterium]